METRITSSPDFVIRPLQSSAEVENFFLLNVKIFRRHPDLTTIATKYRQFVTEAPHFHPDRLRGAFLGTTYLGGYYIPKLTVCMGSTQLDISGIGEVNTHPDYRSQGTASRLMQDAINYAIHHQHALLLLDGIPNFYHRFGYANIIKIPKHDIACEDILAHPTSPYHVRLATVDDIPDLLTLYQRHYGPYSGYFPRTYQQQRHLLDHQLHFLAMNRDNEPCGYLILYERHIGNYIVLEVAADDWPAALALLQHHIRFVGTNSDTPKEIQWPLPLNSLTFYLLADNLSLRSETDYRLNGNWMVRPAHLPTLFRSFPPLWQERLQRCNLAWSGTLALTIDDSTCHFEVTSADIHIVEHPSNHVHEIKLSSQVFTQLLFGYRSITWAMHQPGQQIPNDLIPLLSILFAQEAFWIPGSNSF